jgi:hypothetical protein
MKVWKYQNYYGLHHPNLLICHFDRQGLLPKEPINAILHDKNDWQIPLDPIWLAA